MGAHSGKFGVINGHSHIVDWSIEDTMSPAENVVSSSGRGKVRTQGVRSWSGSFNQLLSEPTTLPGSSITFSGYTAPDDDTAGSNGVVYGGTALLTQAAISWDWAGGSEISSALTFVGSGALTTSTSLETDSAIADPDTVCGTKVEWSTDGITYTEVANLTQAALTLTSDTKDVINSSSNCWTQRVAGNYDWTVSLTQQDTSRTALTIGTVGYLRMYVDASNFWLLNFGIVTGYSGISVNVNSGDIISQTINIGMCATDGTDIGQVLSPASVRWWGVAP